MRHRSSFPRHIGIHGRIGQPGGAVPVTTIVDTSTPVPGGKGTFTFLTFPTISQGNVAVQGGSGRDASNLYTSIQGTFQLAVAIGSPVPDAGDVFTGLGLPWISGDQIAFLGQGSQGSQGIYTAQQGRIARVADKGTPFPGTKIFFSSFAPDVGADRGQVAFAASASGISGIFVGGAVPYIRTVATTTMSIPSGSGTFTDLETPAISGGLVAFFGSRAGSPQQAGIYASVNGGLVAAADLNTKAPDGSGNFKGFGSPAIGAGIVAFHAVTDETEGIYAWQGGKLITVANLDTSVPGASGTFNAFQSDPSADGDIVAFRAYSDAGAGLYASVAGKLIKIVDQNDTIVGKSPMYFGMANGDLSAGTVAFYALTGPGAFGIYTASL